MFSLPERSPSTTVSWLWTPMRGRICFAWEPTSYPRTVAFPEVFLRRVVRTLIVVLFPAPLGPRNPKNSPSFTPKSMPLTALVPSE